MARKPAEYAMYRGEEFLDVGTLPYLATKWHKSIDNLRWLSYPTAHRRAKSRRILLYKLEDDV